jgi:site-specific recombinase XerD
MSHPPKNSNAPPTILDWLFKAPAAIRRQTTAPLYNERVAFLTHMRERHRRYNTLRAMAPHLLHINRTLGFTMGMRVVTMEELKHTAREWAQYAGPLRMRVPGKGSYEVYMRIARGWLRFHSCLAEPRKTRIFEDKLRDFEKMLVKRDALAPSTIEVRARHASWFLKWIWQRHVHLRDVGVFHIERYLDSRKAKGWAIATLCIAARAIEKFLRHAEGRRWVRPGLAFGIPAYAIPRYAFVPKGPSWKDVQKIISSFRGSKPVELRDHAMILLMAVYGLRTGDVIGLHLTDVDFAQRILTVRRRKNAVTQRFPLNRETLSALRKYIDLARPLSDSSALFITLVAPYEPLKEGTLYDRVQRLFVSNGIDSRSKGPHALRHACANRLMEKGASVAEIAAFLGHADTNTVRAYTRYDHNALRRIAEFSLEGLL